jgi:proteasome lid subunit RPN8/RPN11
MIQVEREPWTAMVEHARRTYPNECCGALLGSIEGATKTVRAALALENAFAGRRRTATSCARRICWRPTERRGNGGWT